MRFFIRILTTLSLAVAGSGCVMPPEPVLQPPSLSPVTTAQQNVRNEADNPAAFGPSLLLVINTAGEAGTMEITQAAGTIVAFRDQDCLAATAAHSVADATEIMVVGVTHQRPKVSSNLIAFDAEHDLALISFPCPETARIATITASTPKAGDSGFAIGQPSLLKPFTSRGYVRQSGLDVGKDFFLTEMVVAPGFSGAGFMSSTDALRGVVLGRTVEDGYAIVASPSLVSVLLEQLPQSRPQQRPVAMSSLDPDGKDFGRAMLYKWPRTIHPLSPDQ